MDGVPEDRSGNVVSEKKYRWTKESVFEGLKESAGAVNRNCVVEAVDGVGSSVVVSMYAVDDTPISITMNGEEILADVVMFSLSQDEMRSGEVLT